MIFISQKIKAAKESSSIRRLNIDILTLPTEIETDTSIIMLTLLADRVGIFSG
jgi:hypothetical protein